MNPLLQLILASLQNQQPQQNNMLSLFGGTQQQTPEQQLLALLAGNQPQQNNPLQSLLNMNHQQPQGGDINQQLLSLLLNQQKPQQTPEQQLLAMLQGSNQQQQSNTGGLDLEALQKLLHGNNSGDGKDKEKSIIDILKEAQKSTETEKDKEQNLEKLVQLKSDLKKFVEENDDLFPDYFNFETTCQEVEKWAGTVDQTTQGWTAAIAKAFFDVESNRDALEERDRSYIEKSIAKAADRSVDRDKAWDLLTRSKFNLSRQQEQGHAPTTVSDKTVEAYEKRFNLGAEPEQQSAE